MKTHVRLPLLVICSLILFIAGCDATSQAARPTAGNQSTASAPSSPPKSDIMLTNQNLSTFDFATYINSQGSGGYGNLKVNLSGTVVSPPPYVNGGTDFFTLKVNSGGKDWTINAQGTRLPNISLNESVEVSGVFNGFTNTGSAMFVNVKSLQTIKSGKLTGVTGKSSSPATLHKNTNSTSPSQERIGNNTEHTGSSVSQGAGQPHALTHSQLVKIANVSKAAWRRYEDIASSFASSKTEINELNELDKSTDLFTVVYTMEQHADSVAPSDEDLYQEVHDFTKDVDQAILFDIAYLNNGDDETSGIMLRRAVQGAQALYSFMPGD